jgi:hypothetical protein
MNPETKEHPCSVSFEEVSEDRQAKDYLFNSLCVAWAASLENKSSASMFASAIIGQIVSADCSLIVHWMTLEYFDEKIRRANLHVRRPVSTIHLYHVVVRINPITQP